MFSMLPLNRLIRDLIMDLIHFINSDKVKRLVVDLLTKLAESTENSVDDEAVKFIERGLFGGPLD